MTMMFLMIRWQRVLVTYTSDPSTLGTNSNYLIILFKLPNLFTNFN